MRKPSPDKSMTKEEMDALAPATSEVHSMPRMTTKGSALSLKDLAAKALNHVAEVGFHSGDDGTCPTLKFYTALEAQSLEGLRESDLLARKYRAWRLLNTQKQFGDAFTLVGIFTVAYEICPEMLPSPDTIEDRNARFEEVRAELAALTEAERNALRSFSLINAIDAKPVKEMSDAK